VTEADTRTAYDTVAILYTELFGDARKSHPLDRGLIAAFAELVHDPVADLGCGPGHLTAYLAELHRVLAPGGQLLLGFFASPDTLQPFDHKVTLAYRWPVDHLADLLEQAGLVVDARMSRAPAEGERFEQGRLLARKPENPERDQWATRCRGDTGRS